MKEDLIIDDREIEYKPEQVGIATATMYKGWHRGDLMDSNDKVRGDLAIEFIKEAKERGYQIVVVDGGSSQEFKEELYKHGISVSSEKVPGMSSGRRQAFSETTVLSGVKVICWSEPEKVSFVRDCLIEATLPIIKGVADVVVPKRDALSASTYPSTQVVFEKKQNDLWNKILRQRNLLKKEAEDLEMVFGPKLFRNTPEVLDLFMRVHRFEKGDRAIDQIVRPDLWSDTTIFPLIAALNEGFKVVSVTVPYRHPQEQTKMEQDSPEMNRKRVIQYRSAIISTIHYIRNLEGSKSSKLMRD